MMCRRKGTEFFQSFDSSEISGEIVNQIWRQRGESCSDNDKDLFMTSRGRKSGKSRSEESKADHGVGQKGVRQVRVR